MTEEKQIVIDVQNVRKSFKKVQAVKGISLKIAEGRFVALLGPNGAGKTTLVEMIEGIQKPDSGDILIMGKSWKGHADRLHHMIGLSLQQTNFIDKLNVTETLRLFASFYGLNNGRVAEIIDRVGLREKAKAYSVHLSGGQRQRLALGIALLNKPRILLLDEPTTGLDPNARREIWHILKDLKQDGRTSLVLTTHYMEEAEQLCDDIVILDEGRILREGTLAQLLKTDQTEKRIEFTLESAFESMDGTQADSPFDIQWDADGESGNVMLKNIETDLPAFIAYLGSHHGRLKTLEYRRRTLDDLFIEMTGRRLNG